MEGCQKVVIAPLKTLFDDLKKKKSSVTGNRTRIKRTTILHDNHYTMTDLHKHYFFKLNNI